MGRKRKPKLAEKVLVTGIADRGKSVARDSDGKVIFLEEVVPGDIVDALLWKKKKGAWLGKVQQIHQYSDDRVTPFCEHFEWCGGCKWQHLSYAAQLKHKQTTVANALQRIGKVEIGEFQPILGAQETRYYRNKLEFSFSNKRWLTPEEINTDVSNLQDVLGFHRAGAFDKIIDIHHCWLQPDPSNAIRNTVRQLAIDQELSFYDARSNKGFMRNMIIRITSLNEIMVIIAFSNNDQEKIRPFLDQLSAKFPEITSLYYCINPKVNDYLMDLDMLLYRGTPNIKEKLGEVFFQIGPKSFFQTNTRQGKALYNTVVDFANFRGDENVYDLYTGLGSIALFVAAKCQQVVGIEEVAPAIENAKENALLNGIQNAIFYAGDVKDILTRSFADQHGKPDLLITDPPRAGMHPKVVEMLMQLRAPRMVYVSCNPATQARDLNLLKELYTVEKVRPVDMFPHTHHIENVALLVLRIPNK